MASAVARANVELLRDEGIIDRVKHETGPYMQQRWRETFSQFEHVDDVRGVGLIQAFTLVRTRASASCSRILAT